MSVLQVLFVGYTYERDGAVSLDDLELVEGVCPPQLTCTFDANDDGTMEYCEWKNYFPGGSMLQWSIGSGLEDISSAPQYVLPLSCGRENLPLY